MTRFLSRALLLWLVLGSSLRSILWVLYPADTQLPSLSSFLVGALNDVMSFLLVAGLFSLVAWLPRQAKQVAAAALFVVVILVFIAEVFFWTEFEARLNRLVFHYLAYPVEVLVFLQDQFFLGLLLIPVVGLALLILWFTGVPSAEDEDRYVSLSIIVLAVAVLVWGQPFGQNDSRVRSAFASNGYLGVLVDARYDVTDVPWLTRSAGQAVQTGVERVGPFPRSDLHTRLGAKKHVVLIIEESFAGPVWSDPALSERYLPEFTALAKDSLSFNNLFATGSRTTRGMEAILNGFPPLPGISTTARRGFDKLPSLARALAAGGFDPVFLYGGWPDFSNFSNYWRAMGFRKIWSREDFGETFETSWGVSDDALFERLLEEMDTLTENSERVFLSTLTVSNHRPYDFPDGIVEFPHDERKLEYAMAFADSSLGRLFRAARAKTWYDDTLFVIVADHGPRPKGDALFPIDGYRIPLVLHASGVEPREFSHLGSSISLPSTLVNLFDIDSEETFYGEDLLCDCDTVVPVEFNYHIGLLSRERLEAVTSDGQCAMWSFDVTQGLDTQSRVRAGDCAVRSPVSAYFAEAFERFYPGVKPGE